jgi:putative ABC transport system ATP-binding protein
MMVTHSEAAAAFADRVLILSDGALHAAESLASFNASRDR